SAPSFLATVTRPPELQQLFQVTAARPTCPAGGDAGLGTTNNTGLQSAGIFFSETSSTNILPLFPWPRTTAYVPCVGARAVMVSCCHRCANRVSVRTVLGTSTSTLSLVFQSSCKVNVADFAPAFALALSR